MAIRGSNATFSSLGANSGFRLRCPGLTSIRGARPGLLPRRAHALGRFQLEVAAKRIDVDASAAHKARIDGERLWRATAKDVDEHALDAALVKCRVPAERDQIP